MTTPNRPEAGNMQMTDEQRKAIESGLAAMEQLGWTHRVPVMRAMLAASPAAPSPAQTERRAFEEWMLSGEIDMTPVLTRDGEFYDDPDTEHVWRSWQARAALQAAPAAEKPKLTVWYGPMPESNGKTNWTAILHRGDLSQGNTIDRSEYPDRVRYESDCVRWLIGELTERPWILDYDADKHSGYVAPQPAADALGMAEPVALDMSLEARLADAEADVARLHKEKMDLWMQVHGYTEPQPAQTAQSGEPVGYRSTDPRFWNAPQPSPTAVVPDDERAAFEAWAKEALEAHYDEHDSLITYDPVSAWLAWQARAASPQPVAQTAESTETCKPGGCTKIGCEGGHYCFNTDGTRKAPADPNAVREALAEALAPYAARPASGETE